LHGIGKTTVIKQVFEEAGLKYLYLSASTLDPWVDFVGVPKVIEEPTGSVLELIRPRWVVDGEVEAIFIDEFNRSADKIVNATLELIQFKSINGHKLNNLKVIWAAINPEDDNDTYSVNHLDPAHIDRFQVHYKIPYKVDEDYFLEKYPITGPIFISWWGDLPEEIQKMVSPRRLEYAADAQEKGCRLEDFLPVESNVSKLRGMLKSLPFHETLKQINDDAAAELFVKDINNATRLLEMVKANSSVAIDFFMKYGQKLPKELVEPFSDFLYAKKQGFEVVNSIEELIDKLPNDKGNQGTAAIINNVHLDLLYKGGGNLENDLRTLSNIKHNLIAKLANRCADVMITVQGKTLERIFWGIEGAAGGKQTNFQQIVIILSKIGGLFTSRQRSYINQKLYTKNIVVDMNFL
jgi:hypothetical protein